jgi:hypothetical protein
VGIGRRVREGGGGGGGLAASMRSEYVYMDVVSRIFGVGQLCSPVPASCRSWFGSSPETSSSGGPSDAFSRYSVFILFAPVFSEYLFVI